MRVREKSLPAHRNKLRSGQVLNSQIVFEKSRDANNLFGRGRLSSATNLETEKGEYASTLILTIIRRSSSATHLAEEFLELFRLLDLVRTLDTGFTNSFLQELGHFESNLEELSLLLVLQDGTKIVRSQTNRKLDNLNRNLPP
jgi:hypothetical protein